MFFATQSERYRYCCCGDSKRGIHGFFRAPEEVVSKIGISLFGGGLVGGSFVLVNMFISMDNERKDLVKSLEGGLEFPGVNLSRKKLGAVYMPNRVLYMAALDDSDLSRSVLIFADLRWVSALRALFVGSDLSGASAENASFSCANFSQATLDDVSLQGAVLRGANLSEVVVHRGNLRAADMTGAVCAGAVFVDCVFDDAVMPDDIRKATVKNCQFNENTKWPKGYVPQGSVTVRHENIAGMGLVDYLAYRREN